MGLSKMISRNRPAPVAEAEPAVAAPAKPDRHLRVGLWVLSTFATIAALVAISTLVIGPQNADMMILVPLAMFWAVAISIGFAIRSAMLGVARSMTRRITPREEKPDATQDRLARMVRNERNREALRVREGGLIHAV